MGFLIPSDWDNETWCNYVICWPLSDQWRTILVGLLTLPTRGRQWDETTGNIVDTQAVGYEILSRNITEGCGLSCLDDIIAKLDCICNAIYNSQAASSGGSSGAGTFTADPSDFIDDGVDYPDGYGSRSDYDTAKCNLAQFVINRMAADFRTLAGINVAGLSAAILAGILTLALATPISFVFVIGLASAILSLAALGIGALVTGCTELAARIEAIDICDLYEAETAQDAVDAVEAWIDGGTYTQPALTKALGKWLVSPETINPLFDPADPSVNVDGLPEGDCSGCGVAPWWNCVVGTLVSYDATSITLQAELTGGEYLCSIGRADQVTWNSSVVAGSWSAPVAAPDFATALEASTSPICTAGSGSPWDIKSSSFLGGPHVGYRTKLHRSHTAMTVTFTWS